MNILQQTDADLRAAARVTRGENVAPEPTAHDLAEDALRKACGLPKARVA